MTQIDFHKQFPGSGVGKQYPWLLEQLQHQFPSHYDCRSLLDYGCGQGGTAAWLEQQMPGINITRYDPYVAEYSSMLWQDRFFDAVYSADVLEHIPRGTCIAKGGALAWINSCTRSYAYLIIDLTPAKKTLADGTNAHVNLQTPEQWIRDIELWMQVESTRIDTQPDKTYGERKRLCVQASRGKKM